MAAPTIEPPTSIDPYLYGTSFSETAIGAEPADWTITVSGSGEAIANSTQGYRTSPVLAINNQATGGRTTAATPAVTRPSSTNLTFGFAINVTEPIGSSSLYFQSIQMSGTSTQGSNIAGILRWDDDLILNLAGPSTDHVFILNTWYLFRVFVNLGAAPITGDPDGEFTVEVNSTAAFQGGVPVDPSTVSYRIPANGTRGFTIFIGSDFYVKFETGGDTGFSPEYLIDAVQIGEPATTSEPSETGCREFPYESTVDTDVTDDADVAIFVSALEGFRSAVSHRTASQTTFGFLEVTVEGDPLFAADYDLSLRLATTAGTRWTNWTVTVLDCAFGAVFGYTGIEPDDIVGGTYFDPNSGHVRPISSSGLILSLDMETRTGDADELRDFSGLDNHATTNGTESVASEFDGAQLFNTTPTFDRVEVDPFLFLPGPRVPFLENPDLGFAFYDPQPISLVFHLNVSVHDRSVLAWWGDESDNASFGFRLAEGGETFDSVTLGTDGVAAFFYDENNGVPCGTGSIADNETHRLILATNGRGPPIWNFYLDGVQICSIAGETLIPNIGNATDFRLGPHPSAVDPYGANVTVDEFHLFTREISEWEAVGFEPFPQVEPFDLLEPPTTEEASSLLSNLLPGLVLITVIPGMVFWLAWWGYNEFRGMLGKPPREFPLETLARRLRERLRKIGRIKTKRR